MKQTQICTYCGYSFEPKVRFRQKFCCNSCRVLYSRHKCNRTQYESIRVNQKQAKATQIPPHLPTQSEKVGIEKTPAINIKKLLSRFENKFLGELYSPDELTKSKVLRELTEAKNSPHATQQETSLLTMILQKLEVICRNNETHEKVKIILKTSVATQLESYLS